MKYYNSNRFVIVEICREPDEDLGYIQIWYYKKNRQEKQVRIIESDGSFLEMFYDEDGEWHRDGDLPAFYHTNGHQKYYYHGILHREHFSPAVINTDGLLEYWVYGEKIGESCVVKKI